MAISSDVVSPTSPTHTRLVRGSTHTRKGLRWPHTKMRGSGAAIVQGPVAVSQPLAAATLTSGLSLGIVPSRLTRRILPLPLLRQLPYLLRGGVASRPVSPTLT